MSVPGVWLWGAGAWRTPGPSELLESLPPFAEATRLLCDSFSLLQYQRTVLPLARPFPSLRAAPAAQPHCPGQAGLRRQCNPSSKSAATGLACLWGPPVLALELGAETGVGSPARRFPKLLRGLFGLLFQSQDMGLGRVPSCKADVLATEGTGRYTVLGVLPSTKEDPQPATPPQQSQLGHTQPHCPQAAPHRAGTEDDTQVVAGQVCVEERAPCHCISGVFLVSK